jgi:6-phosphogluconolactonase
MATREHRKLGGLQGMFTRRDLVKGAIALTAAATVPQVFAQQPTGAPPGRVWLYISTYTGAPGAGGNGNGIYLCELNLSTGKLTVLRLVAPALPAMGTTPSTASPSTIALDPTRTHLYAGNEYGPPGAVSAQSLKHI